MLEKIKQISFQEILIYEKIPMKGEREDMHIADLLNDLINQTQIALQMRKNVS